MFQHRDSLSIYLENWEIDYFLMTQESSFEFSRAQTILAENLCCNREIGVIPDQLTKKKLSAFPGHNVEKTSWTTFHS